MNRNVEAHFSELPSVDIPRSVFSLDHTHKTSFNAGELIPFYWSEVLPGDTHNITTSVVARLQTLLTPIMDNVYMDTYYFFVPARLCWTHWKEFMGENTGSAWIPSNTYRVPVVSYPETGFAVGTIADYMGIPTGVCPPDQDTANVKPIALPFRALALICQEWFRDQNLTDPLNIPLGDADQTGSNGDNYINDVANGGKPFKVAKFHDLFSSCLPAPQKGPAAGLNLVGSVPVVTGTNHSSSGGTSLKMYNTAFRGDGTRIGGMLAGSKAYDMADPDDPGISAEFVPYAWVQSGTPQSQWPEDFDVTYPVNLWANLQNAPMVSVAELRLAFQLQRFYEKNARAGTRYRELLREHFSVVSPDARMMIPEYLGGHRFPLQIHQVTNTSQSSTSFLGDLGAMSNTADVHGDFVKSFSEHGYIIGVCCVRYDHSYPQGLSKAWTRRDMLDYYFPVFANVGEQPIFKRQLMLSGAEGADNDAVFGYNEAWAEYRYMPDRVSGEMRPGIANTLASWHLADYYTTVPSLSDAWIREDKTNVDRALAVTSAVSNQIFADFYIQDTATRPMPVYSIPGLIDHH